MKYVTYDPGTGEIKTWGECDVPMPEEDHGTLLEDTDGAAWTHYVRDGALVAYTPDQVAAKAARPEFDALWSNTAFVWVDQRSLAQAKVDQWVMLKSARDAAVAAGFTWDGSKFDSDNVATQRIGDAVTLAMLAAGIGQPFSIDWTLFDNTTRTLAGADMIAVGIALGTFVQVAFATGVALREQVNAATSVDQVRSITWPAT